MEIIGHKKQWEFLKKAADHGKISHAYLFCGQDKLGKRTVALEWISLLFGEDLQKNQHPDLIFIAPQKPDSAKTSTGKKEIQISQIRDLIWKLSLKPYSAPFKAVVIDQAHLMNQEAQTSLLKTLEEPKGRTFLILITEMPEYLFPTIRSRAETLKFYPVKAEEIKNYLKKRGVGEEESEEISKISQGRPGVAVDFISDPQRINLFQDEAKELNRISTSEIAVRFQYAKTLSQNLEGLKGILDIWLSHFRNILLSRLSLGSGGKMNSQYSVAKLKNILKRIQTTKFLISTTNVNARLALEILMLEL